MNYFVKISLFILLCFINVSNSIGIAPKKYIINLDMPARQRWSEIAADFKSSDIRFVRQLLDKFIPEFLQPLLMKIVGQFDRLIPSPYADEIRGFAADLGIEIGDVLIPNIVYELAEFCTSIVIQDATGKVYLARNLDFVYKDFLRNGTIEVDFQRNGKTLYSATTFAMYFGIMTGQRPSAFAVSLNARNSNAPWLSALTAILDRRAHLIGFLVRDTLDAATSYEEAVQKLAYTDTIAETYFAVTGVKPGQGVIISKARLDPSDLWYLDSSAGRWFLVQTNYDHWLPPPSGDDRQTPAIRALNATGQARINVDIMYQVLSTRPVLQESAIYTAIMSAGNPTFYKTWIRDN